MLGKYSSDGPFPELCYERMLSEDPSSVFICRLQSLPVGLTYMQVNFLTRYCHISACLPLRSWSTQVRSPRLEAGQPVDLRLVLRRKF